MEGRAKRKCRSLEALQRDRFAAFPLLEEKERHQQQGTCRGKGTPQTSSSAGT